MFHNREHAKKITLHTRSFADILTVTRGVLGFLIAGLGVRGKEVLPVAGTFLLFAWISDVLDGPLARRDRDHAMTWVSATILRQI